MSTLKHSPVHIPSRADLRYVRSVLATVHDRRATGEIERFARGPIRYIVRVLAACRGLTFIFRAQDGATYYTNCGPTLDRVIDMANAVVDVSDIPLSDNSPSVQRQWNITSERVDFLQDAIEQLADALTRRRDVRFMLVWQVAGDAEVYYDQTPSEREQDVAKFIRMFVEYDLSTIPTHIVAKRHINYSGNTA